VAKGGMIKIHEHMIIATDGISSYLTPGGLAMPGTNSKKVKPSSSSDSMLEMIISSLLGNATKLK
jgi:hypothetical protein